MTRLLYSNLTRGLKKIFYLPLNKMYSMGEPLAVGSRLLYLLTPYAIAIIPIIVGYF
jgi:hypothetical protein